MAELPDDMSPFQIGTSGRYKGERFNIIGRLKMAWQDGYWNEWFIDMADNKKAWLAEAQGTLAIVFEMSISPEEAKNHFGVIPKLNSEVKIAGITYTVSDIKESLCSGSEGELPFPAPKGRKVKSIDLIAGDKMAGIEYSNNELESVFVGQYVEFDDLAFNNLRELEGWKMPRQKSGAKII
jgi:hypothetical protein